MKRPERKQKKASFKFQGMEETQNFEATRTRMKSTTTARDAS